MTRQEKIVLALVSVFAVVVVAVFAFLLLGGKSANIDVNSEFAPIGGDVALPAITKPLAGATAESNNQPNPKATKPATIRIAFPKSMQRNDLEKCLAAAKSKNQEFIDGGDPIYNEPTITEHCVEIKTTGRGAMEFYPNGYGVFIDNGDIAVFCFFPDGENQINLRVHINSDELITITNEQPDFKLHLYRDTDVPREFKRVGDWDLVADADELEAFALRCFHRIF